MSEPSSIQFPWLKRLSFHLWARLQCRWSWFAFVSEVLAASTPEARRRITSKFTRTLLAVGEALDQQSPSSRIEKFRAIGFCLRAEHYNFIASSIAVLPAEWTAEISQDQLMQIIRFARMGLEYTEKYGDRALGKPRLGSGYRIRFHRQKRYMNEASQHATLATVYLRLNVGDLSQNMEQALDHYRAAANCLAQENDPSFSLCSAGVWTTLGTALLSHPTENRAAYAEQAVEALQKARQIVTSSVGEMEPPNISTLNQQLWRDISLATRFEYSKGSKKPLELGSWRMFWGGVPDIFVSGAVIPFFASWVDWELGLAYQYLGEREKALESLDSALRECPDDADVRTAIELCKGRAHFELQGGQRAKNLALASASFKRVLAAKEKIRSEKTFAQALIGDARVSLEQIARKTIGSEQEKEALRLATNQLRAAARIGRRLTMHHLLRESLFLLGKAYELQHDWLRTFRALALAARVTDRLERQARTPRFSRYLVGGEAEIYKILVAASLVVPSRYGKGRRVPVQRALCFAERGRTLFLQTQLATLKLLPQGASEEDLKELFARRRAWHEADLRLTELESTPGIDSKTLITLRERRRGLEARYFDQLELERKKFSAPEYDPDKPVTSLHLSELRAFLYPYLQRNHTALVEYCQVGYRIVVFVVLPSRILATVIDLSPAELEAIEKRWQEGVSTRPNWKQWENTYLLQVLQRLRRIAEVPNEIISNYTRETGESVERVIVVPHRFLHLIPLQAVEISDGRIWGDIVSIQYVPSASVLLQLLRSAGSAPVPYRGENRGKAAVICYSEPSGTSGNRGSRLIFSSVEAEAVAEAMGGKILSGPEATPDHVIDHVDEAAYIHFACHATLAQSAALDWGLRLAPDAGHRFPEDSYNGSPSGASDEEESEPAVGAGCDYSLLTLGDIFRRVHLRPGCLVVLSACESGITKVEGNQEYIGLPAGFLYAGASTVVSSLWRVSDVATWLLVRDFAREIAAGADAAMALRCAQQRLRSFSRDSVTQEINRAARSEADPVRGEQMTDAGRSLPQEDFPFASPYWWAGFTVNGL